ncbi:helix-turn-helix domain-containing protein [Romboutsia hominis]|uniref:DNA-binding protein, excisionase n=1 Tax=Romboutsia hominis TaxID=1507512 RepID=A0A2P2BQA3_9FIRM|nr:helix-turn-helix domain-containing protein [Romboutsia hominis]CEI72516.1 DNA-binding protein, excisionase [Romboutsia hominis]
MTKKCYICDSNMNKTTTSIKTGWGEYKLTIDGISANVCPNCGEITLESKEAIMIQKLSKSLSSIDDKEKPNILNLTEVADLLRVSNQTIYNMIRDGRIKAYKVGREWRFLRKDIETFMSEDVCHIAARGQKNTLTDNDTKIIEKYL